MTTTDGWNIDPARLDRNWRAIEFELDAPRPGRLERLLRIFRLPTHLTRLVVATPALRRAWFVAIGLTMAVAAGQLDGTNTRENLFVLLLLAPLVPVLGVSFAYGVEADPAHEIAVATPMRGLRLILTRSAVVLTMSTGLLSIIAVLAPGAPAIAFAWLLPSLGLTVATVALMSFVAPRPAALAVAVSWVLGVLIVQGAATDQLAAFGAVGQGLMVLLTGLSLIGGLVPTRPVRPVGAEAVSPSQVLAFGLSKRFGSLRALDGVDVSLHGGLLTLLGPNGSGKTTLLRCLATIVTPDEGSLLIDGLDPVHEVDRIEIRSRLGYLPQDPGLASSARVFDVVDYVAVLKRQTDERWRRAAVFETLERVGLADRASEQIRRLSGGMRQRVALAQALLGDPSLLLLDEPAAGLDPDERFRLREIISERRRSCTILQSTHLTDEAAVSDTVLVMSAGRIVFAGPPARLADRAAGRTWLQQTEPRGVRAFWRQANGWYRCLGEPPAGAALVDPTLEDGYLLLQPTTAAAPVTY